jgi:hypothetical protein
MSIDYLRVTSRRKSKGTQHAVKDITGNSIKIMGQTNKREGIYLISHGWKSRKVDRLFHLTTIEIRRNCAELPKGKKSDILRIEINYSLLE